MCFFAEKLFFNTRKYLGMDCKSFFSNSWIDELNPLQHSVGNKFVKSKDSLFGHQGETVLIRATNLSTEKVQYTYSSDIELNLRTCLECTIKSDYLLKLFLIKGGECPPQIEDQPSRVFINVQNTKYFKRGLLLCIILQNIYMKQICFYS